MKILRTIWAKTRTLRAGIVAGAIGGLLAGGVGSRVVMSFVAAVDEVTDGRKTDSGATVGEFTIGGTLELFVLTTIAGIIGGLLYIWVRRWIPATHIPKGIMFGLAVMIVPGIVTINPDNPDFQMFQPILLFHAMFIAVFLLYGLMVALMADSLHPERLRTAIPGSPKRAIAREVVVVTILVGLHLFIAGGIQEGEGSCIQVDGSGGCAVRPAED